MKSFLLDFDVVGCWLMVRAVVVLRRAAKCQLLKSSCFRSFAVGFKTVK